MSGRLLKSIISRYTVAIQLVLALQMEGTSFTMTFIGQGFGTKITDLEKDHEDLPDKKIVTEVVGPG